ncbi:protein kinase C-binding protein NELL1 isoform X3 [Halyomorpha halys]|uniref:protein kinase C-binding protein NELL1 isoform X3 n=1 Tax=Halyomorpha halys TaxID=286706 RepID=UPI0006D5238F
MLPAFIVPALVALASLRYAGGETEGGLELVGVALLQNSTGVTLTQGLHPLSPAVYLQGSTRELRVPDRVYREAVQLLKGRSEFTLTASARQEPLNSGSLIAFSAGLNRYLELQSSGRKDEVRLHYTSPSEPGVRVETFPYRLADSSWHRIALSVSGPQVELVIDCHPVYRRALSRPLDTNFSSPQLSLWLGQRNSRHSLFKGALQDVRIIVGAHGYLRQCPFLDSGCPTCGQFSSLEAAVTGLSTRLQALLDRLEAAEVRISQVEACDCIKSCQVNGTVRADGASWQADCNICSCVHGEVECRPVQCPVVNCKRPVLHPGQCCPTCLKQCYLRGTLYEDGEVVSLKQCVECECRDGSMHCTRIDPDTMCPPLDCPVHKQFSAPDECCKFCPGVDYCSQGHDCHSNASCLNLETSYACHCNAGFTGNGHQCIDIDECTSEGGLEGHHCRSNTKCLNTRGGYECECLPGHRRVDRFNCAEIDECAAGTHECHMQALCVNTLGSYHCTCKEGYSGDGIHCQRTCPAPCQNGGSCSEDGECTCRTGYTGQDCSLDLNECEAGIGHCDLSTQCVNMPGWYYCACRQGYVPALTHLSPTLCIDVDECVIGNHTCHETADCINVEGGFRCQCPANSTDCRLSCVINGQEVENGGIIPRGECEECRCVDGVVHCTPINCDCALSPAVHCCPHCYPTATSCVHQELPHVIFRSGERWIYQCQTCECLMGEIDCWEVECPPIWCESAVLSTSDCCPRCPSSCPANTTCPLLYQPHVWAPSCASCNCRVPFCDLLVSNNGFCVHRSTTTKGRGDQAG